MEFERTVLRSGIRVLSARVPGQRSVSVGAWLAAGSRDEPAALCGVSHFLEHLVFKGTPSRSALQIAESFDAVGGDLNAYTTKEFTCFHARTLSEDLALCVSTIADIVRNASLAHDDVESERHVVLEEIASHEDTPDDIVFDMFHETLLPDQPLGRRVQGVPDAVAAMSADDIRGYHRAHYTTDPLVVGVAGDVDHATLVDLVRDSFGDAAVGTARREPARVESARGVLTVGERDVEQAHLVFGTQGIARDDPRRWALGILNSALGAGMSSRLWQEIRERRGLAYSVSSGHQGYRETGIFNVYAGCSAENVAEVLKIVRATVDDVVAGGLGDDEFDRARRFVRGSLLLSLDDQGSLMSHLGKSELLLDTVPTPEQMLAEIDAVTPQDVRAIGAEVLGARPWTLVVLGPHIEADLSTFVEAG